MFDEIAGLPAHPLLVHFPVVLILGLCLVAVGYAAVPATRRNVEWAVMALAIAAPLSVAIARESGETLRRRLAARGELSPDLVGQLLGHATLARTLLALSIALAVASFGLVLLKRVRRTETASQSGTAWGAARVLLRFAVCALAGAAAWYLAWTGHTGSYLVWNGV